MPGDAERIDLEVETAQRSSQFGQPHESRSYSSRLEFLYRIVEDTQDTIRFIDTKAAFCVTLSSGMVAAALQSGHTGSRDGTLGRVVFLIFLGAIILTLLVCLRVIFPVVKPQKSPPPSPSPDRALTALVANTQGSTRRHGPKFFIGHNKKHHWLLHTIRNTIEPEILSESHDSYITAVTEASDAELLHSMCDEVLMISLIRQIKSDRLHTAMFCLAAAIGTFCVLMAS